MDTYPTDPKLTKLRAEWGFWVMALIGLPGVLFAYGEVADLLWRGGHPDITSMTAALAANPLTIYLAARQYPRGKAAEATGAMLAPLPGPTDPEATVSVTSQDQAETQVDVHVESPEANYPAESTPVLPVQSVDVSDPWPGLGDETGDATPVLIGFAIGLLFGFLLLPHLIR